MKGWTMSDTTHTGGSFQSQQQDTFQIPKPKLALSKGRLLGLKFFLLGALALFLTIPLFMVLALVQERESRFRDTTAEIAQQWGGVQQLTGPMLVVPAVVAENTGVEGSGTKQVDRHLIIVPETVDVKAQSKTETLTRGIHNATVYQTVMTVEGAFNTPDLDSLQSRIISVDWSRARLVTGLSEPNGIETVKVVLNGSPAAKIEPGASFGGGASIAGFGAPVDLTSAFSTPGGALPFKLELAFKGSQELNFIPLAKQTDVAVSSTWPHPSFSGAFLPKMREVKDSGFSASWSIPELARNIAPVMIADQNTPSLFSYPSFGVRFYQPVDFYRLVERAVKYGVIFIGAAFLIVFAIELLSGGRMHLVQYAMSGMMIIMFFVLLLAFAEHVGFGMSYAIASGATGAVISWFVASLFPGRTWTLTAFGSFAVLYGLLYMVLRLEETALLAGAITGFMLLTVLMVSTRKVEWQ
jgi:inner membrane protein